MIAIRARGGGRSESGRARRSRPRSVALGMAFVAFAIGPLAGCGGGGPSPAANEAQRQADMYAIEQIEVTWHKASSKKDVDLMMSLWADNATFTTATKTYTGKDEIRTFFATQAAPFKAANNWVSDTPAYKTRISLDGDRGTIYFECDYVDVATRHVEVVVSADQTVARINGAWLITSAVSATPGFGS